MHLLLFWWPDFIPFLIRERENWLLPSSTSSLLLKKDAWRKKERREREAWRETDQNPVKFRNAILSRCLFSQSLPLSYHLIPASSLSFSLSHHHHLRHGRVIRESPVILILTSIISMISKRCTPLRDSLFFILLSLPQSFVSLTQIFFFLFKSLQLMSRVRMKKHVLCLSLDTTSLSVKSRCLLMSFILLWRRFFVKEYDNLFVNFFVSTQKSMITIFIIHVMSLGLSKKRCMYSTPDKNKDGRKKHKRKQKIEGAEEKRRRTHW